MARAAKVFKDDAHSKRERLAAEAEAQHRAADAERERAAAERLQAHAELAEAMQGLGAALKRLAAGDLSQKLADGFSADYAGVRDDLNLAIAKLKDAMLEVVACADAVRVGANQMASASNDLSHRTEAQASTLEATTASLAQISNAVRKSADAASHARKVVAAADEEARKNTAMVSDATSAMDAISKSHADISQIIGVIDEIAFQTNLLALNAGVEAARAGDAGKGFAVVASEVRALALRSAEAAKQIKALISSSGAEVATGVKLVGETGGALAHIFGEVSRINEIVNEIATGANEQTTTLATVSEAVGKMDEATQQNAAMVEQSNAATLSLSREAERLAELVGQFSVGRNRVSPPASTVFHASVVKPPAKTPPAQKPARRAAAGGGRGWEEF